MIENLIKVMKPPMNPVETGDQKEWENVEEKMGTTLPDDYKEFIMRYGMGRIGNFLWVLNPFSKNGNLLNDMKFFHWAYDELKKDFPENYLRPPFPENHSLIIWGATDNGDYLFWIYEKNKNPNNWKVGIYDNDYNKEDVFEMNMSTFLEKLVKNEIQTDSLPEDFLDEENIEFQVI